MKYFLITCMLVLFVSGCISSGGGQAVTTTQAAASGGGQAVTTTQAAAAGGGQTGQQSQPVQTTVVVQTTQSGGIAGALNSIASAINSGAGYKCTYTEEGVENQMSVKGQKYHAKTTSNGQVINSISDGVWAYVWVEGETTGTKFNIKDLEGSTQGGGEQESTVNDADINQIIQNAMNVQCVPTVLPDGEFTAPGNVEFQDLGELLKQMQQLQGQGVGAGGG